MTELFGKTQTPVLVAIGEERIQEKIASFLRKEGYDLVTAEHGKQALHLLEAPPLLLAISRHSWPRRSNW